MHYAEDGYQSDKSLRNFQIKKKWLSNSLFCMISLEVLNDLVG